LLVRASLNKEGEAVARDEMSKRGFDEEGI
jgi:hypothetical protein